MEYLGEKVAYLKGLVEGMNIDYKTNEGKVIHQIISVLGDFVTAFEEMEDEQAEISDHLEEIDEDLADLEYEVYDEFDDEYDDEYDYEIDDDDMAYYEIECPNCQENIYLDEELLEEDDDLECPNCKQPIEIEFDCDCDCGCEESEQ